MLLLALLCVPWVTNAQSSLTVADGTETNNYVPIYGYWADNFNRDQIIYPADSLTAMVGQPINSMTFYSSSASASFGSATFTVRMAVVTQSTLTDFVNNATLTECWQGDFTVENGVAYIEFDSPFLYTGGNLLVDIYNTPGSYLDCYFYGVTLSGASVQNYNYNGLPSSGGNARNFMPKTTFEYGTITCPKPTNLTIAPNNSQATLSWTAGGTESNWIVYVDGDPVDMVSTPSYTLNNLTSNTVYEVAVRAYCGVDDTSVFVYKTFRSQCFDYTPIPYATGFEDDEDGELPNCWEAYATGTSGSGTFPSVYDYATNARNGDIYFEFESNSGQTEIAVLPPMQDISSLQLTFYAACMNANFTLEVGVVGDDSVFVPVDTVALTAGAGGNWHNSYYPYTVYFDEYSGSGEHIAMRVTAPSSYTIMIDDISVTEIPDCRPPTNFTIDSIGTNWIGLSWIDEDGSGWQILVDSLPFGPDTATITPLSVTDNYVVLTGLVNGLEYTAYLRADCGGENSPWVGPLTFVPGQFSMSYSGTDTLRGCGLTIYDFDGASYNPYTSGANSMLVLYPSSEDSLIVFSGSTDIYSSYAHLRIYDGVGTNGTLLWESSNSNETIPQTSSFSGPITIHFNAGSYNYSYTGFEIVTSCVAAPQCAVISNLQTPNVGVGAVYVTWNVSGLNLGTPTGYEVVCFDSTNTPVFNQTVTSTNAVISGLTPGTPYTVAVRTVCGNDNYGEYESVVFNTQSLACAQIDAANSNFDTIGNGTEAYNYLPSYGFYNYSLTQQIYTAAEIGHGGLITAISMMPSAVGSQRTYEIYLAHTTASSLSGFIHPSDMVQVYNGDPNTMTADQWTEYVLDQPFNYNGSDNLLVCFRDMTGSWASGNTWYTHTTSASMGCYVYQDGSAYDPFTQSGGNTTTSRNNITISMMACAQLATCAAPMVIVDSIGTDFVAISWGAGYQESSWQVEYRPDSSDVWISAGVANTESWYFSNLGSNVRYHFRVGAICSDTTIFAEVSALTKCGSESLPFIYGFEDFPSSGYPACWYKATTYSYGDYPSPDNSTSHGGSYSLYMYSGSGTYSYLALPEFAANIDTLEINFWIQAPYSDNTNELYVGVMTDAENFSTFQNVAIVSPSQAAVWEPVRVRFNHYTGNGTRIAIVSPVSDYVNMFIDDITVNIVSPCSTVEGISLISAGVDNATLGWNGGDNTEFQYVYGPAGFLLDTATLAASTTDTVILSGLTANTQYDFYVRAVCGDGDTSNWSNAFSFRTDCVKITTVPYTEGFENNAPGWSSSNNQNFYPCWFRSNNPNDSYYYPYVYGYESHTGIYSVYWDWSNSNNFDPHLALPAIDTNAIDISSMMLSFWAIGDGYGDTPVFAVGTMTNPQSIATFQALDTVSITSTDWFKYEILLSNYSGNGEYIALRAVNTGNYWSCLIDDFMIDSIPSCMHVYDLAVTSNTSSSVTLGWTEVGSATSWEIAVATSATATPVADTAVSGTPAATINGLTTGTTYYFWVRSVCSATDASAWEGPVVGVPGSWFMRPGLTDTIQMCGGVVYDDGGLDGAYGNNQDSYLIIRPDTPGSLVSISGTSYTESTYDYLRIYDGESTDGVELWNDYGVSSTQTFGPFVASTGSITLYFHSDVSVTYDGFEINVSCVADNCPVSDLMLDETAGVSSNSLTVTWTGSSTSYDVAYGPAGFDVDTVTSVLNTTTNSITVTGLDPITSYDVYVRGLCNAGDTGMWHKVTLMTALCDGAAMIYNFDTLQSPATSSYSPVGYSYYNYSYVQTIIPAERLTDLTGDVTAMAFQPASTSAGSYFTNMTIWMSNVTEDRFDDGFILEDSAHVFSKVIDSADFTYNSTEWQIHVLDTAFVWDGVSNILVSVSREHGAWTSGSSFAAHDDTVYRMAYDYNDNYTYDPATASINLGDISSTVGDILLISCGVSCPKPTLLPTTDITYQSATINWDHNTATDFEVAVKAANDPAWPAEVAVNNATSYAANGLNPATNYQFRVRAICDATEGLVSDWVEGTFVTDSLPCFDPTDLHTTALGFTTATLAWEANASQNQWSIRVWTSANGADFEVTSNPYTVTGLAPHTTYYAAVKAICGGGLAESEYSDTIQFTTETCAQVTGVSVSQITANSAVVSWNAVDAVKYEIEYGDRNFNQGTGTTIVVNQGTSYTLTGLTADYDYSVFVRAYCEENVDGAWSDQVDFTTPEQGGGQGVLTVDGSANISIFPNPTTAATTIAISGVNGEVEIAIVDMNGRTVASETMSCNGDCTKRMEVSSLAQGAYFVRVKGDNLNMVKKLIVK